MKVDLHCHSNLSDGQMSPLELVQHAGDLGIGMLAITDHDRADDLPEVEALAQKLGIRLIPGIEVSCQWQGRLVHVVGLNIALGSQAVTHITSVQTRARQRRALEIGERLAKQDIPRSYEGAKQIAGDSQIGRPHFARYLVEVAAVKDLKSAYKKYLGSGKVGDVKTYWPEMEEVVDWLKAAAGIAVLAHPAKYRLSRRKLDRLCLDFCECGGLALELVSGLQAQDITDYHQKLCEKYHLYASCGSDFHGPVSSWHDLGKMTPLPPGCRPVWQHWQ